MQTLRNSNSDFLSNNNFIMRSALILLSNIISCLIIYRSFYYYSKNGTRAVLFGRGFSGLFLYTMLTLFICAGTKNKELFSRKKLIFMVLFAIFDTLFFVYQILQVSLIKFDITSITNQYERLD